MDHEERNRRKASLRFRDEEGAWYALDNAAIIMPAVSGPVETSLFRLSATLDAPVRLPALQEALERVAARFPYFVVELRRGLFWHYLVPHAGPLRVEPDSISPCQGFDMHRRGTLLFRVRARERTIACEFSHIIADGTGGMRFLRSLLVEYFRRVDPNDRRLDRDTLGVEPDLPDLDATPDPGEMEDAYNRYYPGRYPYPKPEPAAFHFRSERLPRGVHRLITGVVDLAPALAKAKEYGVTLTAFLAAAYLEALQTIWFGTPGHRRRSHLSLEIPVNLRSFFETATNRNFSLFVHAWLDLRLGPRTLPEIAVKIHHQLGHDLDAQGLKRHISRNVRGGRALFIRAIPLFLKAPVMRALYTHFGMNIISGLISNLGPVRMPTAIEGRIERFDFVGGPSSVLLTGASALSWKGKLYLGFGSLARSRELERLVLVRLQTLGIPVRVECNLKEW